MSEPFVRCEYDGCLATVTLDRAPDNVMNIAMMEELNAALLDLRERDDLKVLALRGSGASFCGGVDLTEHNRETVARMVQVFQRIFETMRLLKVIAVAIVDGPATGAGFELAIGCNLVLASASSRFRLPQVGVGTIPLLASVILPRAAARRKAMEWILTGDEIAAHDLERFGLVNRVYPDDEFDREVDQFLKKLLDQSGPVMQLAKRAQIESYYATYEEALYKVENLYLRDLLSLYDSQEGIQAYLEDRPPQWRDA